MDTQNLVIVPVINTPKEITGSWLEVFQGGDLDLPKDAACVIPVEPIQLSNCIENIDIVGICHETDGSIAIVLTGDNKENVSRIKAVTVSPKEPGEKFHHYRPVFGDFESEQWMAKSKALQTSPFPVSGVGAFIMRYNENNVLELLLARRIKGPISYLNRLSNFGGAIDLGESMWESLCRELKEEVNLTVPSDIEPGNPIHFDETIEDIHDKKYHAFSTTFAFLLNDTSEIKNMEKGKCRNFGWYSYEWLIDHKEELTPLLHDSISSLKKSLNSIVTI